MKKAHRFPLPSITNPSINRTDQTVTRLNCRYRNIKLLRCFDRMAKRLMNFKVLPTINVLQGRDPVLGCIFFEMLLDLRLNFTTLENHLKRNFRTSKTHVLDP